MPPLTADEFFASSIDLTEDGLVSKDATISAINIVEKNTKKDYRAAYQFINVTSYSQREILHGCPREFQIHKSAGGQSSSPGAFSSAALPNLHFVFGHSVGAGIQTYLCTGNKMAALFAAFLAWDTDLDSELVKQNKSSSFAILAVEKFILWWKANGEAEWELAFFNGKPAVELTFFLDTENGSYHAGHIDAVLRHRKSGRYMVLEIKTTSVRAVDEAQYGNSEQPLGYSLVLDKVVEEGVKDGTITPTATSSFEVLYLIYSTSLRQLIPLPFTKVRSERAEWLQDLLLDHTIINTYEKLGFFPKRGNNCWSFGGRCSFYGLCDMGIYKNTSKLKRFDRKTMPLPEDVDFEFSLSQITSAILTDRLTSTSAVSAAVRAP